MSFRPSSWASRDTRELLIDGATATASKQNETQTVLELGDSIKLQTTSPAYTLQRLAALEARLFKPNDAHRGHLLEVARLALQVAYDQFKRARHAARQGASNGRGASDSTPTIQFADATDLQTYAVAVRILAEELENSMSNFGMFQYAVLHYRRVTESLRMVVESVASGGAEAEMWSGSACAGMLWLRWMRGFGKPGALRERLCD